MTDICPACHKPLNYEGPQHNPGLHFRCPACSTWIEWDEIGIEWLEEPGAPTCQRCGASMVRRRNHRTRREFWGCSTWSKTKCRGRPGPLTIEHVCLSICELRVWREPEVQTELVVWGDLLAVWERNEEARKRYAHWER